WRELRDTVRTIHAAVFGNGNTDVSLVKRMTAVEEDVENIKEWIIEERAKEKERQREEDDRRLKRQQIVDERDRRFNRKLNLVAIVVTTVSVVSPVVISLVH
ncbi:MAG: hypothetical protein ACTSUO_10125, partial [Candidatus Thorarchaeota archaeon]